MTNEQITWVLANLNLHAAQPERAIERSLLADAAGVIESMLAERRPEQRELAEALAAEFPLLDDEGLDEIEHHCEWAIQQDRKRLHALIAAQPAKFAIGDRVRKTGRSSWQGIVVGTYSSSITPEGYAVESECHPGSVQIYPAEWLELVGDKG